MSPGGGPAAPVRVVIADDEPLARATLRGLLAADSEVELVAECANGEEVVRAVRELEPDLLFLDVQMPGVDGFEALEQLSAGRLPGIVFVTAYDRYALRAFEVHAVDYLLKPFDDERFYQALERAKSRLRHEAAVDLGRRLAGLLAEVGGADQAAPADPPPPQTPQSIERLTVQRAGRLDVIDVGEVDWIEAADQYVQIHTREGAHLMRESMARLERELDPGRFLRIHRSAIVALARVRRVERSGTGGGRVLLDSGRWLPVSRSRVAELRARLR